LMTIQKNKRRHAGGTVKACGMVPVAGQPAGEGGFRDNGALRLQRLKQQAMRNRQIAARYHAEGNADMAGFWLAQARACVLAANAKGRPDDRVTDGVEAFYQRLRAESPRQIRLKALQELQVANTTETVRSLMGGLMVAFIFILFSLV
jgi:hypothetical protein